MARLRSPILRPLPLIRRYPINSIIYLPLTTNQQSKANATAKLQTLCNQTYQNNSTLTIQVQQLSQQIRQYKKFVAENTQNFKMQLARLKTSIMIPLQSKKAVSQQTVLAGFSQLRQNLAKTLTKTEFQSLYSKQVWNEINTMKEQLESLKKEVVSHEQKRRHMGHIIQGIEKYEEFISDNFEKVYEKQENVKNYSMKHMADEFDRKVAQTVLELKQQMNGLKTDFDNLYVTQAKKAEINKLWRAVNVLQTKLSVYKVEADQMFT